MLGECEVCGAQLPVCRVCRDEDAQAKISMSFKPVLCRWGWRIGGDLVLEVGEVELSLSVLESCGKSGS